VLNYEQQPKGKTMDYIQTVKELRDIAAAMASGDRSNQALGAVYDSIMELSYKLQDADKRNMEG